MQTPRTQLELLKAVREIAGQNSRITVEAQVIETSGGNIEQRWWVCIARMNGCWSTELRPSLAGVWLDVYEHFCPSEIQPEQFDVASVEAAHA